ncbi:UDP-N-acetylmuramoyl-tripeptide--D-alanyl-D-alanine ligase [Corynebacterium vitaeruminis]|uniref:UDP-N-acetylmuramoyl-tripeptide--D-alanyl-D- alanine ligase n=1 Tax=Corynebacterium vitaeruminis TaxID=38305 RepID=UPI0023F441A6|nr:UDP-N-acetylmuramoyl-tripeptide--D-alanyl-D-alanine ligase [Corynebacterium vitaeruminis]
MINLSLADIARIVGGRVADAPDENALVTGNVEFDSRKIGPGDLFLALAGARVDGHDFAVKATEQGAVGTLAFREVGVPAVIVPPVPEEERKHDSYALENDADGSVAAVLAALGKLARHVVDTLATPHPAGEETVALTVIGVTGSAGKTSTKDFMATIFRAAGATVAPPGSFNNEIGHPYTALKCEPGTRYLVAEMSARGLGHVANLARIAPPKIGVELNVGSAHLGEFGSRETIAQAKGELVEALPDAAEGGVAVLNANDDFVMSMSPRTKAGILLYSALGKKEASYADATGERVRAQVDIVATNVSLDELARPSFDLTIRGEEQGRVQLGVFGEHQVANCLAAIGAAVAAGLDTALILGAVASHHNASAHRMDVRTRADGVTVINDSYNANPESMRAGLKALVSMAAGRKGAASWAVLGPMGELGEDEVGSHADLGRELASLGVDKLVAVGDNPLSAAMKDAAQRAGVEARLVADNDAAAAELRERLRPGDVVLVKASNAFKLWQVAEALADAPDASS